MEIISTENLRKQKRKLNSVDESLWVYNGLDCMLTAEIFEKIKEHPNYLPKVYSFMLASSTPALKIMTRGILIDVDSVTKKIEEIKKRIECFSGLTLNKKDKWEITNKNALMQRLSVAMYGKELNPNSPKQIKELIYGHLNVPYAYSRNKKSKGEPSVDREALEKLSYEFPRCELIAKCILRHRDLEKTLGVLSSKLDNNRFYCSMNVAGTETGRWSSNKNPLNYGSNAQNITESIRTVFLADPGYTMFYADLEQAESITVAHLSGDENYINACKSGDLHTQVAKMLFPFRNWTGDPIKDRELADEKFYREHSYRDIAKRAGHGMNYGMSPYTLAVNLKIFVNIATELYENYFKAFPGIKKMHDIIADTLQTKGYLVTPLGRRRQFYERLRSDTTLREGIAYVPQSTVGDILNIGLTNVHRELEPEGLQILLNGHDAILGQIPDDEVDKLLPRVLECMSVPVEIGGRIMTIGVDAAIGKNWGKYDPKKKTHKDGNPLGLKKWSKK